MGTDRSASLSVTPCDLDRPDTRGPDLCTYARTV